MSGYRPAEQIAAELLAKRDPRDAELTRLRAELAAARGVNDMLLATMQRIAKRDFNCAPHQHGMAAQAAAEAAITAANVATARGDAA